MSASLADRKTPGVAWPARTARSSAQLSEPTLHLDQAGRLSRGKFPQGVVERVLERSQGFEHIDFFDFLAPNGLQLRTGSFPSLHPAADCLALFHSFIIGDKTVAR